jgi:opacity protein-like surface antigen
VKTISLLLLCSFAGIASAQSREMWFSSGWSQMSNSNVGTDQLTGGSANDLKLKGGFLFAVRFDVNQGSHIGHEFQYVNSRAPLQYTYEGPSQLGAAVNQGGYNFLGYFNGTESKVRVFGTVGAQLSNFARPSDSALGCTSANCTVASQPPDTGGNSKFGFNYGGGAKFHVTSKFGIRFDVRQYVSGKPFNLPFSSGLLRQTEISGGVGVIF